MLFEVGDGEVGLWLLIDIFNVVDIFDMLVFMLMDVLKFYGF